MQLKLLLAEKLLLLFLKAFDVLVQWCDWCHISLDILDFSGWPSPIQHYTVW